LLNVSNFNNTFDILEKQLNKIYFLNQCATKVGKTRIYKAVLQIAVKLFTKFDTAIKPAG